MQPENDNPLKNLSLGKVTEYIDHYQPDLLQGVPRSINRREIDLTDSLPFTGADIWNGYEISWLNNKGKPVVAIGYFEVPFDSPNLVESKSFKLYLNSFNQSKFDSFEQVESVMAADLSKCAGKPVKVVLVGLNTQFPIETLQGDCIDELDIEINSYQLDASTLTTESDEVVEETLVSHLLKSNCLITNQPDWASVQIRYVGKAINKEALLNYLISFRQHNEFHEQCVERIFMDITANCNPTKLSVYARYTRRGGLDINPFRSNFEELAANTRLIRQ